MRYDVAYGEHGTNAFFIRDHFNKLKKVCGVVPSMFDGDIEKTKQMAIKICELLNDDHQKSKA